MRPSTWTFALACAAATLALTLTETPRLGGGWRWDVANALGFAAFAGLVLLHIESGAGRGAARHEQVSWSVLLLVVGHVVWFLATDPVAFEYLKAKAPWYMLSGLAALGLLLLAVALARPGLRKRFTGQRHAFRRLHFGLAWAVLALSAFHVAGSGFYVRGVAAQVLLVLLVVGVCFAGRLNLASNTNALAAYVSWALLVALFLGVRSV